MRNAFSRVGVSSGPRSAAPPTVFPSTMQRSATQGLYEATRWASAPTSTPMLRALFMRGGRFIASAPASALPGPSAYIRDDHRDQLKVEEGVSRVNAEQRPALAFPRDRAQLHRHVEADPGE